MADELAKAAVEFNEKFDKTPLNEEIQTPMVDNEEIMDIQEEDPWMVPLIEYLQEGKLPEYKKKEP